MKQSKTEGLLKISEVANAAGTSVTTVKYYVKEGLVDIACKTGRNMAYYAPESVERVKLIRALQSEKYYPLSVIRHMLKTGSGDAKEVELLDTINKADRSDYYEQISVAKAAKEAGLKPREAEALICAGIIVPTQKGRTRTCCRGDCRVMKLAKIRMDAGIPLEQTIKTFSMHESYLKETTQKDIESLVADGMLTKDLSTEDIMNIINVSDETLDSFIGIRRYAMNAALGAAYIAKTHSLLTRLERYGKGLCGVLDELKYAEAKESLKKALEGQETPDKTMSIYSEMLRLDGAGLAETLSVLHKAVNAYKNPEPKSGNDAASMTGTALRLGLLVFAPEEFGCDGEAARDAFIKNTSDKAFAEAVLQLLDELQN